MLGMIISAALIFLFLFLLPFVLGGTVTRFTGLEESAVNDYTVGFIFMMALCEILAVPCAFFKVRFTVVVILYLLLIVLIIIAGIVKTHAVLLPIKNIKAGLKSYGVIEYITLALLLVVLGTVIVNSVRLYVVDQDDSRFVVTAADMIRTDTLFLADPSTGIVYDRWSYGVDAAKDIVAPHAVFCAVCAMVTSTSVTMFMHTVYPVVLYILAACVYYNLISELIEGVDRLKSSKHKEAYAFFAVALLFLYAIFQYSAISTRETVFLIRLWQGKAILAGIIIPALLWVLYRIYRSPEKSSYILLFIVSLAGCLTSSMATLLIPMLLAVYGVVYGIARRSVKVSVLILISAVIPAALAVFSICIRNEMLLCF